MPLQIVGCPFVPRWDDSCIVVVAFWVPWYDYLWSADPFFYGSDGDWMAA